LCYLAVLATTLINVSTQALQLTAVNNLDDIGLRQITVLSGRINIAGIMNLKDIFLQRLVSHTRLQHFNEGFGKPYCISCAYDKR